MGDSSNEEFDGPRGRFALIHWYLMHFEIAAICGVLIGAFVVQFAEKEMPCPLCMIQRMAMMLAAMGPFLLLGRLQSGQKVGIDALSTSYGLSIIASVVGVAVSSRQVLLHILPGDPGYGSAVFGMHLYTWGVVVFVVVLAVSGLTMLFARQLHAPESSHPKSIVTTFLCWLFIGLILANVVATFVESGFHPFLPDNPTGYELLDR